MINQLPIPTDCYLSLTSSYLLPLLLFALQIVFQPNNQDKGPPMREQMFSRNNPSAPEPVQKQEVAKKPFQFLWVGRLREYLALEFKQDQGMPFKYDQERVFDDFGEC